MISTIRSDIPRIKKIKYAKLSKRVLPIHKWTGMSAFIILIYHAYLAIDLYGFNLGITKVFSGLFGLIILTGIVIFGWLRWFKASYIKRMIHLWLGLLLFRSEEHTSELQSRGHLVCRLLLEKKSISG